MTEPAPPVVGWVTPHDATPVATSPFRSAGTRARVLLALLGMNLVIGVLTALHALQGKGLMASYVEGTATDAELEAFDTLFASSGIVESGLFIVTAITWLAWQSRSVDNIGALGVGPSKFTPRWSIGWWFLPFANLVMPYRVHRDLQRRYQVALAGGLVMAWWLLYLAMSIVSNAAGRIWLAAESYDEVQAGLTLWAVSSGLTVVAAFLAIIVVRRFQAAADVLAAGVARAPIPAPEPEPAFDGDPPAPDAPAANAEPSRDQSSLPSS